MKKYLAFNFEFAENVLPVSFGLFILSVLGEIFLFFLDNKKLISLNFPLLCVPINIFSFVSSNFDFKHLYTIIMSSDVKNEKEK